MHRLSGKKKRRYNIISWLGLYSTRKGAAVAFVV
jgi:hypothetical protein